MKDLYVVLPYFNFLNSKNTNKNLNIFIENFKKYKNAKLILVEGYYNEADQLRDYSKDLYKHIKVKSKNILWIKENLINIGFDSFLFNYY